MSAFQEHFTRKTLRWTSTEDKQGLLDLTQPKSMGCLLECLTIVGEVPISNDLEQTITSDNLLTKALINFRLNSIPGRLQSVTLQVQGGQDNSGNIMPCEKISDWRQIWMTAAQTFEVTCRALVESALPVQKLDIFDSISRCSLACDQVKPIIVGMDLPILLENLESLSLSLSHHITKISKGEAADSLAIGNGHAEDIARFLAMCSQLENLDLHWYNLLTINLSNTQVEERRFFNHVARCQQFSHLRSCRLAGIHTDEAALLLFLGKATELSHLTMEEIHLEYGEFSSVFEYLTSNLQHLAYLHLDDLWESRLICFSAPGEPHCPSTAKNGPNNITRIGTDCQRKIKYNLSKGRILGSPQAAKWHRQKRLLYGPPDA